MIKKIMLVRHAKPDFPDVVRLCLGRNTDIGIGEEGRALAYETAGRIGSKTDVSGKIFTSPLKRAVQTAKILSKDRVPVFVCDGLSEMDQGEWDGLDFDTIRKKYGDLYEKRREDLSVPPPGGETFSAASARMRKTLSSLAASDENEIIIAVTHSGAARALLCDIIGLDYKDFKTIPFQYAGVKVLLYDTQTEHFELSEEEA